MTGKKGVQEIQLSLKKQFIFCFCFLLLLLVVLEVGIRGWAYFFRTSYERYNFSTKRLELAPNLQFIRGGDEFLINSKGFVGPEFSQNKQKEVTRIFALGDSCTFSSGIWKKGYPAILEQLLNGENSKKEFEVINAGIEGYNSTLARDRINDEILNYEPDVVMIYIGWNDLMKSDPQSASTSRDYGLLAKLKEESYLIKAYRKLFFFYLKPLIIKPKTIGDYGEINRFENFIPVKYQANLEAMIKTLRGKGIKAILFTLPTVVTSTMTYQDMQKENVFFPFYGGAYSVPDLLSLLRAYNNVILRLGKENNIPIVDLDRVFNETNKRGLFWDTMHPSYEGHKIIATSVFSKIREIQSQWEECRLYGWDNLCVAKHD